ANTSYLINCYNSWNFTSHNLYAIHDMNSYVEQHDIRILGNGILCAKVLWVVLGQYYYDNYCWDILKEVTLFNPLRVSNSSTIPFRRIDNFENTTIPNSANRWRNNTFCGSLVFQFDDGQNRTYTNDGCAIGSLDDAYTLVDVPATIRFN